LEFSQRQKEIITIVKAEQPITAEKIAEIVGYSKATLRPDFSLLTMSGILTAKPKVGYLINEEFSDSLVVDQIARQKIEHVMAVAVNIPKELSIQDAIIQLFLEDCGSLYIVEDRVLVGIVSRKDLLKGALGDADLSKVPVGTLMSKMPNIYTIFDDTSVLEATRSLVLHAVDSLPVLSREIYDSEGKKVVVGKFSKSTATRQLLDILKKEF